MAIHTSPTKHLCCLVSAVWLKLSGYHHSCWAQPWLLGPPKKGTPYVPVKLHLVRLLSSLQSSEILLDPYSQSLWFLFHFSGLGSGALLRTLWMVMGTRHPCLPSLSGADPCVGPAGSLNCPQPSSPPFMLHVVSHAKEPHWGPWLHGTCPSGPGVPRYLHPALLDPQEPHRSLTL